MRVRRLLLALLASHHPVRSERALAAVAQPEAEPLPPRARATVRITPPWPALPYTLACTQESTKSDCDALGEASIASECAEPEQETAEVLASLLHGCDAKADHAPEGEVAVASPNGNSGRTAAVEQQQGGRCVYVDIGCNLGYFAAQAAALGARVDCFEPSPVFVESIGATVRLNHGFERRLNVTHAAVAAITPKGPAPHLISLRDMYKPCYIGKRDETKRGTAWIQAPIIGLRSILQGRRISLLKIDIDSQDGALLHTLVQMLSERATSVRSVLVELGDGRLRDAACDVPDINAHHKRCRMRPNAFTKLARPRSGDVADLWELVHTHGYTIYRVNIHTNREIFDRSGENVNRRMSPQHSSFVPLHGVRAMRKLDVLRADTPQANYSSLLRWGQSLLISRLGVNELLGVAKHHARDVDFAGLGGTPLATLNRVQFDR